MPVVNTFGVFGVFLTVVPGILLGAVISKNIASFLEENDLFVPDDDDED
jgi:essential MCU regulator, mitochondrial